MSEATLGTTIVTQIAIVVHDIQEKAEAWSKLLGLPLPEIIITDSVDTAQTQYLGELTEARCKLAFFNLGQVQLELMQPIGGPSTWQQHLDEHGESVHHIAFVVKGINQVVARLETQGIPLLQIGRDSNETYAYVDSIEKLGLILELLEND